MTDKESVLYYGLHRKSYILGTVCVNTCEIIHRYQDWGLRLQWLLESPALHIPYLLYI